MNIPGTDKLAEAVWKARFGNRNVDHETSVQIWLCAEKNLKGYERLHGEPSYVRDGFVNAIAFEPYSEGEEDVSVLGITHQDIADTAWSLWAGNTDASYFEHETPEARYEQSLRDWFTAEDILRRGERE